MNTEPLTIERIAEMRLAHIKHLEKQRADLLAEVNRLRNALMTCAQSAGDDPFFNKDGEGYEALFGGEEE